MHNILADTDLSLEKDVMKTKIKKFFINSSYFKNIICSILRKHTAACKYEFTLMRQNESILKNIANFETKSCICVLNLSQK